MIKNITRYICDRCGKIAEVDYGEGNPDGWSNILVKCNYKLLCPDCYKVYDKTLEGFMRNKSNNANKSKGRTYTIGIPNDGGSISTVDCSLETEDLSKQGLTVIDTKYKVVKIDYEDDRVLQSRVEYYDDAEDAVRRYFTNRVGLNRVLKIVQCMDSKGETIYKYYDWDAYGPTHGFVPTDSRFGN